MAKDGKTADREARRELARLLSKARADLADGSYDDVAEGHERMREVLDRAGSISERPVRPCEGPAVAITDPASAGRPFSVDVPLDSKTGLSASIELMPVPAGDAVVTYGQAKVRRGVESPEAAAVYVWEGTGAPDIPRRKLRDGQFVHDFDCCMPFEAGAPGVFFVWSGGRLYVRRELAKPVVGAAFVEGYDDYGWPVGTDNALVSGEWPAGLSVAERIGLGTLALDLEKGFLEPSRSLLHGAAVRLVQRLSEGPERAPAEEAVRENPVLRAAFLAGLDLDRTDPGWNLGTRGDTVDMRRFDVEAAAGDPGWVEAAESAMLEEEGAGRDYVVRAVLDPRFEPRRGRAKSVHDLAFLAALKKALENHPFDRKDLEACAAAESIVGALRMAETGKGGFKKTNATNIVVRFRDGSKVLTTRRAIYRGAGVYILPDDTKEVTPVQAKKPTYKAVGAIAKVEGTEPVVLCDRVASLLTCKGDVIAEFA